MNDLNPRYKQIVGDCIFEFVLSLAQVFAIDITRMLTDLPVAEI